MIFVTIGTQEPFDRLIKAMDKIAEKIDVEVIAQVSIKSAYQVKHMKTYNFLAPSEFERIFNAADLVVAHAGMGTIISALVNERPLIVMPRQLALREHRSDHQMATVQHFLKLGYVNVANDIDELEIKVMDFLSTGNIQVFSKLGEYASLSLIKDIKNIGRR